MAAKQRSAHRTEKATARSPRCHFSRKTKF
jgi:hypothetical protein